MSKQPCARPFTAAATASASWENAKTAPASWENAKITAHERVADAVPEEPVIPTNSEAG
jgi:hypothetical protein